MRVAIQGVRGSNSHLAAMGMFGDSVKIVECGISAEVVEWLGAGAVDAGVLAIENSLHGAVAEHYDLLLEHPVRIMGESLLRVRHNVIAGPGVRLEDVRRVLSHPVALSQCRRWLRAHPGLRAVGFEDTAGGVREAIAQGWTDAAGIAPEIAAQEYGGVVLERRIEDHEENYTRFLRLERGEAAWFESADTLSVAFGLKHKPRALLEALEVFGGMNLTRIESRPVRGRPWEYFFFVEARGDGRGVVERLEGIAMEVKVLGWFCGGLGTG